MSLDGGRLHLSGVAARLGDAIMNVQQPTEMAARVVSFPPPVITAPPEDPYADDEPDPLLVPLDALVMAVVDLTEVVRDLRADLQTRYDRVWYRRLGRWLRALVTRVTGH